MRTACSLCHNTKNCTRSDNQWFCDDCLNAPSRTRRALVTVAPEGMGTTVQGLLDEIARLKGLLSQTDHVRLNKIVVRDDDADGPVILIPKDSDLPAPSEAEIKQAQKEQKADKREYKPSNERTLSRIRKALNEEEQSGTEPEPAGKAGAPSRAAKAHKRTGKAHRSSARA